MRRLSCLALVALLAAAGPALAQRRGCVAEPTMRRIVGWYPVILHGFAEPPAAGAGPKALPRFTVAEVIKGAGLRPGQVVSIAPESWVAVTRKVRWIAFAFRSATGGLDFTTVYAEPSAELLAYVKGVAALPPDDLAARAAFFVRLLGHDEPRILDDVAEELDALNKRHLGAAARHLSPDAVVRWLKCAAEWNRPDLMNHIGLLLGFCGKAEHGRHLKAALPKMKNFLCDGLLCGYVLLRPAAGWKAVEALLRDREAPDEKRLSALKAVRYFYEERTDVLLRSDLVQALLPVLDDEAWADWVIRDLRKWRRWELTRQVLRRFNAGELHIRLEVLRFALECPEAAAAEFVRRERHRDPEEMASIEELLQLEAEGQTTPGKRKEGAAP